jgi:hypothetical protein
MWSLWSLTFRLSYKTKTGDIVIVMRLMMLMSIASFGATNVSFCQIATSVWNLVDTETVGPVSGQSFSSPLRIWEVGADGSLKWEWSYGYSGVADKPWDQRDAAHSQRLWKVQACGR